MKYNLPKPIISILSLLIIGAIILFVTRWNMQTIDLDHISDNISIEKNDNTIKIINNSKYKLVNCSVGFYFGDVNRSDSKIDYTRAFNIKSHDNHVIDLPTKDPELRIHLKVYGVRVAKECLVNIQGRLQVICESYEHKSK